MKKEWKIPAKYENKNIKFWSFGWALVYIKLLSFVDKTNKKNELKCLNKLTYSENSEAPPAIDQKTDYCEIVNGHETGDNESNE